jgi:hypothetical protein
VAEVDGRRYLQQIGDFARSASLPRLVAPDGAGVRLASLLVALVLLAPLAIVARRRPDGTAWFWGALVAAVIAAPVGWAMSLVLALPLASTARDAGRVRPARAMLAVAGAAGLLGPLASPMWIVAGLAAVAAAALLSGWPGGGRERSG